MHIRKILLFRGFMKNVKQLIVQTQSQLLLSKIASEMKKYNKNKMPFNMKTKVRSYKRVHNLRAVILICKHSYFISILSFAFFKMAMFTGRKSNV